MDTGFETDFETGMHHIPRIELAAGASGSGKTLITCGILNALKRRGFRLASFKCGPDYIDPMFHRTVLGTVSSNLDTFFADEETVRYLLARHSAGADLAMIEGVMGYYDGLGGTSDQASAWHVAAVTDTPVVLVVNCRGMSLSVVAYVKGFLEYRKDSRIQAVILNRVSPMIYPELAKRIRDELGLTVLGYVPEIKEYTLESRHLGLVMPEEIGQIREKLDLLADRLEETLDLDALIALAGEADDFAAPQPEKRKRAVERAQFLLEAAVETGPVKTMTGRSSCAKPVIAVSKDEAFCFMYEDNLALLEDMGAQIEFFSPLHDRQLPPCDGLILCGGYPELHVRALSENKAMCGSIRTAIVRDHLPALAECGGFMYLQAEMEDMDGRSWPVAGVLAGKAFRTGRLGRFGYIELKRNREEKGSDQAEESTSAGQAGGLLDGIGPVRGHEFHYFDTTDNGAAFLASKPLRRREWTCMHMTQNLAAGFPHLYYHSNPEVALRFFEACFRYGTDRK